MTGFQRLCLATTALVVLLIVVGGTVRATDSGLGCPDWPRCHGSFIPKWEKHTLIEYSHRLTASVVGVMVLAITVWAWRSYRHVRSIFLPAVATFALLLVQGGLGGLTVVHELPPGIVTVHLATALTLLALLILIDVAALRMAGVSARLRAPAALAGMALTAAGLALGVMLLGAYISTSHYSLACSGWPLCNGDVVPPMSSESARLVFFHRLLALGLGFVLLAMAVVAWRGRARGRLAANLSLLVFAIYVAQVFVGASNIWSNIADVAQIAHLAVGTLLWAVLVYLAIRLYALPDALDAGSSARVAPANAARVAR
jgi:heme A synthase